MNCIAYVIVRISVISAVPMLLHQRPYKSPSFPVFVLKVHLVMHVPTGVFEYPDNPSWLRTDDNDRLNAMIRDYSDVILGIYSAHQHFDSFRVFYKDGQY